MRLYRANYSLVARDGRVKVDEQWVFFEAKTYSDALEKIPGLLKAMWDCSEFQFLVSPSWLARLNKALVECRSAGGQHE
ncbi:hypothetical protein DER63_02060 [Salmonella enterica]|nr:hypothetical protein [Salmonella enterica]